MGMADMAKFHGAGKIFQEAFDAKKAKPGDDVNMSAVCSKMWTEKHEFVKVWENKSFQEFWQKCQDSQDHYSEYANTYTMAIGKDFDGDSVPRYFAIFVQVPDKVCELVDDCKFYGTTWKLMKSAPVASLTKLYLPYAGDKVVASLGFDRFAWFAATDFAGYAATDFAGYKQFGQTHGGRSKAVSFELQGDKNAAWFQGIWDQTKKDKKFTKYHASQLDLALGAEYAKGNPKFENGWELDFICQYDPLSDFDFYFYCRDGECGQTIYAIGCPKGKINSAFLDGFYFAE